ncbi:TPA: conjugal transfer protein TraT [Salmonella enterica]|uniref:conjugal transfer protein TraT n=1 Tax=Enterobacter roggenkampii TaxID=1812935 RepID=UPI0019B48617|nr:conjugal transfer protein TraT [Salmonella enterica subsp. enterica serovar Orion]HAK7475003.1 conjugal transfer protein TraT [Salmonella enterica]EJR7832917.1 conjugal transfer protein TraT [Salmonella enterica subsp. enterica serovar Orion]HAK8236178.1 conjugal transfer protein TraT [Salmonella enterica]HAK8531587.1 conjugal transfer protein TraT [Salmonella enterica]
MSIAKKTQEPLYLHPLPLPDVVHTTEPMLSAPEKTDGGRCVCCRADVKHRFVLPESLPLTRLLQTAEDALIRLDRARDALLRLESRQPPQEPAERQKYLKNLKAARTSLEHATLSARRLALRHIPWRSITETGALSAQERTELSLPAAPFHLCYLCHAWHALNGYAAAQGTMVWLPDLHPRSVVALNRKALRAVFSTSPATVREGRKILSELLRHRLPVEERFGGFRPADFADALRRFPPSMRDELREKMAGVALILTPDSVTDREYLQENN